MTEPFSESFLHRQQEQEQVRNRKWKIRGGVFLIHVLVLGVPLLWGVLDNFFSPPKLNAFRVKIGPKELSHAPEVGKPERARPGAGAPAEPEVVVPAPEPEVVVPAPKPKPTPRPVVKKQVKKPVKKQVKKTVRKPAAKPVKKQTKKSALQAVKRPARKKRDLQSEVYRPPAGTNELRTGHSGRNLNPHVPIGSRDRGQALGKADHRSPGGGLQEDMEKYNEKAGMYLKNVWIQPPKSLLGNALPAVIIEIAVSSDGRVLAKKIVKKSGIQAMDESVKNLLDRLDRMPVPPRNTVIQFILQTDD